MAKAKKAKIAIEDVLLPIDEHPYEIPQNWCWVKHNGVLDISGGSQPAKSYFISEPTETSVYKGYKRDKIEMRGDRAEISDFPLYLNTVAGGLDCRDQTIGGFSFVVKIYAVPVVEIIG